jgi:hypothetical protein
MGIIQRGVDDEIVKRRVAVYLENGRGLRATARALGINRNSLRATLKAAAAGGLLGFDPVLPGFQISKATTRTDGDGNVRGRSIQQTREHGEVFEVPASHGVKGLSALVDADGRVIHKWVKTRNEENPAEIIASVEKAFQNFEPAAPFVLRTAGAEDKLNTYIWTDWHVGLHAWGKETDGADWDLGIAQKAITKTHEELVDEMPRAETALILGLGDLCHIDNMRGATPKSGNLMDYDTRYPKIHEVATEIALQNFEQIRRKYKRVKAAFKRGNHDEVFTVALRSAMRMYYRNDPDVTIDTSPSPYYCERFGVNLIAGVHADEVAMKDLPLYMAQMWPQEWAATKTRHWHTGHIHHEREHEYGGVPVFSHRAPVPKDAWHAAKAYLSGRAMRGFKYDMHTGCRGSNQVEIY